MFEKLSILKGIHPGFFLAHELKKRKLSKRQFSLAISEYPQTIGSITKGKRDMNTVLSLRIEKALDLEEGFLMTLQAFYDIKKEKNKQRSHIIPPLILIRQVLFWDINRDKIDWDLNKEFIIERIFERGNEVEKEEIIKFYGKQVVESILSKQSSNNYIKFG